MSDGPSDHVRLDFDAGDPAYPGWVVSAGRVIDPDRSIVVERLGSFSADDYRIRAGPGPAGGARPGLPLVESRGRETGC